MPVDYTAMRGEPSDYDPGPPKNRRWLRLLSKAPNYRGLG